jgi:hypothetical protein
MTQIMANRPPAQRTSHRTEDKIAAQEIKSLKDKAAAHDKEMANMKQQLADIKNRQESDSSKLTRTIKYQKEEDSGSSGAATCKRVIALRAHATSIVGAEIEYDPVLNQTTVTFNDAKIFPRLLAHMHTPTNTLTSHRVLICRLQAIKVVCATQFADIDRFLTSATAGSNFVFTGARYHMIYDLIAVEALLSSSYHTIPFGRYLVALMLNAELLSMTDPKEVNEYYSQPTSFATMYEITLKIGDHYKTSPVLSKADSKDPFGYGQVREEIFNKRPREAAPCQECGIGHAKGPCTIRFID